WDLEKKAEKYRVPGGEVIGLAYSPTGGRLAVVRGTKELQVLNAADGQPALACDAPGINLRAVAYSADGRWIAAGGDGDSKWSAVLLWDAATGKATAAVPPETDGLKVTSLAFPPDSRQLAGGDEYGRV